MIDPFGRAITYVRISVTDRCDFRCVYCMAENMTFVPKAELLTLEELDRLASVFIELGVRRIRLTGGEPLVRRNVMWLVEQIGRHVHEGRLEELTLTTNGSQLERFAADLYRCGVRRINVSLDTLDARKFEALTRWGRFEKVMAGIEAAKAAGLAIKINCVALKGVNEDEFDRLIAWCGEEGFDLTLIETMPMGEIDVDRTEQYLPLSLVRARLAQRWTLEDIDYRTGGQRAMSGSRKRAGASASSRRLPTISANRATACASPARAPCTCASVKKTKPICARPCALPRATSWFARPSSKGSRANPKGTISSSIAAATAQPCGGT